MSRVRVPTPGLSLEADDDIRALMADIDASMADLEHRLEEARRGDARSRKKELGPLPAQAVPEAPAAAAPQAASAPPAPAGESSLLAELAREAEEKLGSGTSSAQERQARAQAVNEALERIFQFFNLFARHANNLEPAVTRSYRLDMHTTFAPLQWRAAFADYRKQDLSEKAYLAHVGFRVRLVAPQPVVVSRRWDQVDALKKELHILDLKVLDGSEPVGSPQQERIEVVLAPDVPVQMRFRGNYGEGRIDVLARNVEGFGIAAFELDLADATQALFDGIGRFLLCRTNQLPPALRRTQFLRESSE